MRLFKFTLFILVVLVIGLVVLQLWLTSQKKPDPDELPGLIPQEFPTNRPPEDEQLLPDSVPVSAIEASVSTTVPLISGSKETDYEWTSQTPAAKRIRQIFPDTDWMTPDPVLKAGGLITLKLFDDAVFEAKIRNVTVYPNGAVGMTAHLTGDERGTVYLSYSEQQMRASVEIPGGADYAVRYRPDSGSHYAIEIDWANSIIFEGAESPLADAVVQEAEPASAELLTSPIAAGDAPAGWTPIDVMIVYTPAALAYEGNLANMNDNIAEAMQRANEAHTNSNTQVYLRLVHSVQVSYTEANASADLDELTYSGGSYSEMDEVHDWRNEYGADFVCLLEDDPYYTGLGVVGGLGWLMTSASGDPDYAFCLARVQQSSWTYTVVHEWGHNMGCSHSKTQSSFPWKYNDFRSYSAGWQWADTKPTSDAGYCTIMTYEGFGYGLTYERVAHFSNPNIPYTGDSTNATGDPGEYGSDNARTIREMKEIFEAYRESIIPSGSDWDNDGLPNDWEDLYFDGPTNANPSDIAANGVNTVMEAYIAGINPTDPSSFFTASLTNQNGFIVRWNATSGRVYSVFGTTNLSQSFQPLETDIPWPQSSWTDTVDRSESFYQVDVKLE